MATNWLVPVPLDVAKVIQLEIIRKANENIDASTAQEVLSSSAPAPAWDATLDDRLTEQLNMAVGQFRGAIQKCGKQALSLTAGSVPPEMLKHVLYLAAYGLVVSTPNLQYIIMTEHGEGSPFGDNFKKADRELEAVTKGRIVTPPSDPTGRDYITAINLPWFSSCANPFPAYNPALPMNPPVSPVRFGANSPPVDLTTYNSIFNEPAPWWFPVDQIGQP